MAGSLPILSTFPAHAEAREPAAARVITASATDLFVFAERSLRNGNRRQAEHLLDLLSKNPNASIRNESRFRQALLLEESGRLNEAAVLLRRILDEQPAAAPVRLKLAGLLQQVGKEDSALRELRALRTADLPPTVARFVDRMSASLQASKPVGFQLELALAPDSNINRASSTDTLGTIFGDFAIAEKAKSGIGAAVRGTGHARIDLGKNVALTARAGGEARLYRSSRFNDIALSLSAGPEFRVGRSRFNTEAGIVQHWFGMEPYQRSLRLSASAARPLGATTRLRASAGARWTNDRVNDLRDGFGMSASAGIERALSPQLAVALSATADRFQAADDAYSTRSWTVGAAAQRDVGRMTWSIAAEFGRLKADERLALLPRARADRLTRVSVCAVFRHLTVAGFAPMSRIVIERNRSSVEFYDYRQTRTEFGVSRAF